MFTGKRLTQDCVPICHPIQTYDDTPQALNVKAQALDSGGQGGEEPLSSATCSLN